MYTGSKMFRRIKERWMDRNVDLTRERNLTNPDFIVYQPRKMRGVDTGNEHFLVFNHPKAGLMALWTQSSAEGSNNQRLVFSKSPDLGNTWNNPTVIAGPVPPATGNLASWGFPLVSKSGRIYAIFNKHMGIHDTFFHTTGLIAGIYSDDCGETWTNPEIIEMKRSIHDNPDVSYPSNWIVWQKPLRLSKGKYYAGFTRWVSEAVRHPPPNKSWTSCESVVEFMRFENIDSDPRIPEIDISYFMTDESSLRVGYPGHERVSVVQEPSIVRLPDNRLFAVMRTATGHPYYSVSDDAGENWSNPEVLLTNDGGAALLHPLSPCPLYQIDASTFMLLYHDHDGHYKQWGPLDTTHHRRPIKIAGGRYEPDAKQPVSFSKPFFFMDHDGTGLGPSRRDDLAMYASVTLVPEPVLWYPDRKFFLLGKRIPVQKIKESEYYC